MPPKETAIALLQFVGLVIPAVAIYVQTVYSGEPIELKMSSTAANYHGIRLTFLYLILAALLLVQILFSPLWLGEYLVGGGVLLIAAGLFTFSLAVVFSQQAPESPFQIFWVYRNAWHRSFDYIHSILFDSGD